MSETKGTAGAPNVDIFVDGKEVPDSDFLSYVVDRDMYQPDMASIVLSNQGDVYSTTKIGSVVEIKVGDDLTSIYKGEVLGLEPTYKGGEKTKILIRAVNKLHKLLRVRKSTTFAEMTDKDIISKIVSESGLTLEWKHEKSISYKHVYQHNLTNLEFLRMRAARMGCHLWCVGDKVFCKEPDLGTVSAIKLKVDAEEKGGQLRAFTPRMSSAGIVKKVTVKGWNPETKELITGEASATGSKLGATNATTSSNAHGQEETFTVDQPIWSKEEAMALAKAKLRDLSLAYITGEAEVTGNAAFELGTVIEITPNSNDTADPFNGKYYVMGLTHRHTVSKSKDGGFVTILRLARDAQKAG